MHLIHINSFILVVCVLFEIIISNLNLQYVLVKNIKITFNIGF